MGADSPDCSQLWYCTIQAVIGGRIWAVGVGIHSQYPDWHTYTQIQ